MFWVTTGNLRLHGSSVVGASLCKTLGELGGDDRVGGRRNGSMDAAHFARQSDGMKRDCWRSFKDSGVWRTCRFPTCDISCLWACLPYTADNTALPYSSYGICYSLAYYWVDLPKFSGTVPIPLEYAWRIQQIKPTSPHATQLCFETQDPPHNKQSAQPIKGMLHNDRLLPEATGGGDAMCRCGLKKEHGASSGTMNT